MIRINTKLLPMRVKGFAIYPFIVMNMRRTDPAERLITLYHEKIHLAQAKELWIIGFYFVYLWEMITGFITGGSMWAAYSTNRLEEEAYRNETNKDYVTRDRKKFVWRYY